MSGPDLTGAVQACHAARNDIREMQADDAEAKKQFERETAEAKNAHKAETDGDAKYAKQHNEAKTKAHNAGDTAKASAETHRQEAQMHLGEYYAKMGRDPRQGTPPLPKDGPDCKPVEKQATEQAKKQADFNTGASHHVPNVPVITRPAPAVSP